MWVELTTQVRCVNADLHNESPPISFRVIQPDASTGALRRVHRREALADTCAEDRLHRPTRLERTRRGLQCDLETMRCVERHDVDGDAPVAELRSACGNRVAFIPRPSRSEWHAQRQLAFVN